MHFIQLFTNKIWRFQIFDVPLHPISRKVGRVIDRAGLEIRYTPFGYRGFESLTFRKTLKKRTIDSPLSVFRW